MKGGATPKEAASMKEAEKLTSRNGTIRGIKHRVRTSIFKQDDKLKVYQKAEANKIVVYATSVSIIRYTYEQCRLVLKILQNHRLRYELRDVTSGRQVQQELAERLNIDEPSVPQVFAGGTWLGDAEQIQKLNENGELVKLLCSYPRIEHVSFYCEKCGGYRYVPCPACKGTKKSPRGGPSLTTLRCVSCDKEGLIRCSECEEQQE